MEFGEMTIKGLFCDVAFGEMSLRYMGFEEMIPISKYAKLYNDSHT